MQSPESPSPIDWEEVRVRADAREWFSYKISLIAWFWDDDVPGPCQPSHVAKRFGTIRPYPRAVRREAPGRMRELLRDEWLRAGKSPTRLPKLTPWQDAKGRTAWRIDLGGVSVERRILVGRALIRMPICGIWDEVEQEMAFPMSAKIRYFNKYGYVAIDPPDALIAGWFEGIDQEEDTGNNLVLLYRNQSSFNAWIEREGLIIEVAVEGHGSLYRLAYPGPNIRIKGILNFGDVSEEEFIGHSMATEILMRFLADTTRLPVVPGLVWRKAEPDLSFFHEEDLR